MRTLTKSIAIAATIATIAAPALATESRFVCLLTGNLYLEGPSSVETVEDPNGPIEVVHISADFSGRVVAFALPVELVEFVECTD